MTDKKAEIGILILTCSFFTYFAVARIVPSMRSDVLFLRKTTRCEWAMILHAPVNTLAILGLALVQSKLYCWQGRVTREHEQTSS